MEPRSDRRVEHTVKPRTVSIDATEEVLVEAHRVESLSHLCPVANHVLALRRLVEPVRRRVSAAGLKQNSPPPAQPTRQARAPAKGIRSSAVQITGTRAIGRCCPVAREDVPAAAAAAFAVVCRPAAAGHAQLRHLAVVLLGIELRAFICGHCVASLSRRVTSTLKVRTVSVLLRCVFTSLYYSLVRGGVAVSVAKKGHISKK